MMIKVWPLHVPFVLNIRVQISFYKLNKKQRRSTVAQSLLRGPPFDEV